METNHSCHEFHRIDFPIIYDRILPVIGSIGLVLNVLILASLYHSRKHSRHSSLDILLSWLAIYDNFVILFSFLIFWIIPEIPIVSYVIPLYHASIAGSDYLNLFAVMERVLALDGTFMKNKESWHQGFDTKQARCYVITIILFTTIFNVPLFFESQLCHYHVYVKLYRFTLELVIFKITPWFCFLIMVTMIRTKIAYYDSKTQKPFLTVNQFRELRDCKMVLSTVILFCVTNIPSLYVSVSRIILYEPHWIGILLADFGFVLNSSLKGIAFGISSQYFRHRFADLFLHPCSDNRIFMEEDKVKALLSPAKVTTVTFLAGDG